MSIRGNYGHVHNHLHITPEAEGGRSALSRAGSLLSAAAPRLSAMAQSDTLPSPGALEAVRRLAGSSGAPSMTSSSGVQVPRGGDDTNHKPRATASS